MPSPSDSTQGRQFAAVVYAFAVVMLGTTMPTPMYARYADELGFGLAISTVVFAIYAAGVITALLVFGRWSDTLGRRPLLLAGIACAAASSAVFLTAGPVWQLLLGRALSGLSAGIFTGTATATIVETAPRSWRSRAVVVAAIANIGGLGLGPTVSGLLVQYAPWPLRLAFIVHLALVGLAGLGLIRLSETSAATSGARLTVQRISVPAEARSDFARAALTAFAGFCVLGLFTAVVPTFLRQSLGVGNTAVAGVLVSALFVASAAAQLLTWSVSTPVAMILGCAGLMGGMVLIVIALAANSIGALLAGALVAGAGQGASFGKGLNSVIRAAPPPRRGEVASAYFVVAYIAISLPVVGVGLAAQRWSLAGSGIAFAAIVAGLAAFSLIVTLRVHRGRVAPSSLSG
ncbi:MFS transporter [Nocardia sp. NPDC060256]|uniref:MFS transporter n=1 Tax=unclassified Nocardia TaxID=2637762 RepID=UPI0036543D42